MVRLIGKEFLMFKALALIMLITGFSVFGNGVRTEIPVYDFAWEEFDTDYDQICDEASYEPPSQLMIWARSLGGAVYLGLCSVREYVVAKYIALQKVLSLRKRKMVSKSLILPVSHVTDGPSDSAIGASRGGCEA